MSWICDICSSANEDSETECFVCGQARSRESILIEKRRRREIKTRKIFEIIDRVVNITLKSVFIIATVFCSILISIFIFQKATKGDLGNIIESLLFLVNHSVSNITRLFLQIANVFKHYFGHNAINFINNVAEVFGFIGPQYLSKWKIYAEVIFKPAVNNMSEVFRNLVYCLSILWGNLILLWATIKVLYEHIVQSGKKIVLNILSFIEFFKSKFN